MKAIVHVTLKEGVLDPQGKAIERALNLLNFEGIGSVRQGKYIEIVLSSEDKDQVREDVDSMCRKLLANVVIEDYKIFIES